MTAPSIAPAINAAVTDTADATPNGAAPTDPAAGAEGVVPQGERRGRRGRRRGRRGGARRDGAAAAPGAVTGLAMDATETSEGEGEADELLDADNGGTPATTGGAAESAAAPPPPPAAPMSWTGLATAEPQTEQESPPELPAVKETDVAAAPAAHEPKVVWSSSSSSGTSWPPRGADY
jgi:hypothetical protein